MPIKPSCPWACTCAYKVWESPCQNSLCNLWTVKVKTWDREYGRGHTSLSFSLNFFPEDYYICHMGTPFQTLSGGSGYNLPPLSGLTVWTSYWGGRRSSVLQKWEGAQSKLRPTMMKTYSIISSVFCQPAFESTLCFPVELGQWWPQEIHATYLEYIISATAEPQTAKARSSLRSNTWGESFIWVWYGNAHHGFSLLLEGWSLSSPFCSFYHSQNPFTVWFMCFFVFFFGGGGEGCFLRCG